jgi:CRISPR-associated protein Cmr3
MTRYYYVRPTDSLFIRGNLAFGESGEHGASELPPPPSLFAGAFRSAILGRAPQELGHFAQHGRCNDPKFGACLGTPTKPGAFRVTWLSLAGQASDQTDKVEALVPLPADALAFPADEAAPPKLVSLKPRALPIGIEAGGLLPLHATLHSAKQEKPQNGYYLRQPGFAQYLAGEALTATEAVPANNLYTSDPRLGIGLDADSRSVQEGLIYTTEGFTFGPRVIGKKPIFNTAGFLVGIDGADDLLPGQGLLRLGGDGRSAEYRHVEFDPPTASLERIAQSCRFRLVTHTPTLSAGGWLPPQVTLRGDEYYLSSDDFSARLVCAALGRKEIVSGWDLFNWKPKDAQAAIPAGSVYWFDELEGDPGKLATWAAGGLCSDTPANTPRRAEGYNLAQLGLWMD